MNECNIFIHIYLDDTGINLEKIISKIVLIIFWYNSSFLSRVSIIYSFNLKNMNIFSRSLIIFIFLSVFSFINNLIIPFSSLNIFITKFKICLIIS